MKQKNLYSSKSFVIKKTKILKKLHKNQTIQIQKLHSKNFTDAEKYNKENQKILDQLYQLDQKIKSFPENYDKKIKKLLIKCNIKNKAIISFYQSCRDEYHRKLNLIEYKKQLKRFININYGYN